MKDRIAIAFLIGFLVALVLLSLSGGASPLVLSFDPYTKTLVVHGQEGVIYGVEVRTANGLGVIYCNQFDGPEFEIDLSWLPPGEYVVYVAGWPSGEFVKMMIAIAGPGALQPAVPTKVKSESTTSGGAATSGEIASEVKKGGGRGPAIVALGAVFYAL